VVLGGGPAGLVAAMTAAAGGHRVAMTEQRLTEVRGRRRLRSDFPAAASAFVT